MAMALSDHIPTEKLMESAPRGGAREDAASLKDNTENEVTNASGHKQELERNFSLLNLCGIAATTGNSWTAIGGSVVRYPTITSFLIWPSTELTLNNYHRPSPSTMEDLQVLYTSCTFRRACNFKSGSRSILLTISRHSIAVSVFYWLIAACIAEMASAMPSSSGGSCSSCRCSLHPQRHWQFTNTIF